MKFIVLTTLLLFLIFMILVSIGLYLYIKELKSLPSFFVTGSEDPEQINDSIYYVLFYLSIVINLLILSSCTIVILQ